MEETEYKKLKMAVLNAAAPHIIALHKMGKLKRAIAIMKGTGSAYLADRYDGDFAGRYLNSDGKNQTLWLTMFGIESPSYTQCFALQRAMLFFYNHSLDHCFKSEWLKQSKINAYGNGENWCKLWVKLSDESKQHVIKFF